MTFHRTVTVLHATLRLQITVKVFVNISKCALLCDGSLHLRKSEQIF
jgi:hypothetical protein